MKQLDTMLIFAKTVELASFSAAAEALRVSKSHISKKITELEKELRVKLLQRSTRGMSLTEIGAVYYEQCQKLLQDIEHANNSVAEFKGEALGKLRIAAPPGLAATRLKSIIIKFLKDNPKVTIDMDVSQQFVNVIEEGYDLVLRSSQSLLQDSQLIAKPLITVQQLVCTAPRFIKQYGRPKSPANLVNYNCAMTKIPYLKWSFTREGKTQLINIQGNFHNQNVLLLKTLLLEGLYIALMPDYLVEEELANGKLVQLFSDYELPPNQLYAIYPAREYVPKKVSLFLEALQQGLK